MADLLSPQTWPEGRATAVARLRSVHRAAADMRRGVPVRLDGMLVLAAETAGAEGLGEMASAAETAPVLVLSGVRAASVLGRAVGDGPVALRTAGLFDPAVLLGVADPTAEQLLADPPEEAALPDGAAAALSLAKIARLLPAVLVAPVRHEPSGLVAVTAADVLGHRTEETVGLRRVAETAVPLADAPDSRIVSFRAPDGGIEHMAMLVGRPEDLVVPPLVRLHSECFTGDLLGSLRCDCGPQLRGALKRMATDGGGVLLYLAQEGRGIGLASKLRAYALQDRGLDTVDANRALGWGVDERDFSVAAAMLEQLGIGTVRLLTNNPDKVAALAACGISVVERVPLLVAPNGVNDHYLQTKRTRLGHLSE